MRPPQVGCHGAPRPARRRGFGPAGPQRPADPVAQFDEPGWGAGGVGAATLPAGGGVGDRLLVGVVGHQVDEQVQPERAQLVAGVAGCVVVDEAVAGHR